MTGGKKSSQTCVSQLDEVSIIDDWRIRCMRQMYKCLWKSSGKVTLAFQSSGIDKDCQCDQALVFTRKTDESDLPLFQCGSNLCLSRALEKRAKKSNIEH